MIQRLNRGDSSGSPDGSNTGTDFMPEQAVFPFFLALPLNPTTFKFGLHLF
jgi:hypothetical protein